MWIIERKYRGPIHPRWGYLTVIIANETTWFRSNWWVKAEHTHECIVLSAFDGVVHSIIFGWSREKVDELTLLHRRIIESTALWKKTRTSRERERGREITINQYCEAHLIKRKQNLFWRLPLQWISVYLSAVLF